MHWHVEVVLKRRKLKVYQRPNKRDKRKRRTRLSFYANRTVHFLPFCQWSMKKLPSRVVTLSKYDVAALYFILSN